MRVSPELAHRHYGEHVGKPFFEPLVEFITSAPSWHWQWRARTP